MPNKEDVFRTSAFTVPPTTKEDLEQAHKVTGVSRSQIVVRALELLFEDARKHGGIFYWMRRTNSFETQK